MKKKQTDFFIYAIAIFLYHHHLERNHAISR